MSIFKSILGAVGSLTGISSVGDAAKTIMGAIKGNPEIEQKLQEMELEKMKLEMAENASVRELLGKEVVSEDNFVRRARPAMLWLVSAILTLNFVVLPIFNAISVAVGGATIIIAYPDLPENVYWLFGSLFSVYTGARSWDKMNKKRTG